MASIIPKEKDGKIVSYKFKSCVGRDDCGKQVFRCMTWKVPAGLSPSKAAKAAEKAAGNRQVQNGLCVFREKGVVSYLHRGRRTQAKNGFLLQ